MSEEKNVFGFIMMCFFVICIKSSSSKLIIDY